MRHPHAGEVLALDRLEIGAAALDAQNGDLAPAVITLPELDGRVAAAPHDERGFGTDQGRRVDDEIDAGQRGGFSVVPARSHRGQRYHAAGPRGLIEMLCLPAPPGCRRYRAASVLPKIVPHSFL